MSGSSSHFLGSLTKKGRLSTKVEQDIWYRTAVLVERLVRIDLANAKGAGIPDPDIARMLKRSVVYLQALRKKRAYLVKRNELTTGIVLTLDGEIEEVVRYRKQQLKELMPSALRVYSDILQNKPLTTQEKRLQAMVAQEVLDREGTFPKISRTDTHVKVEHEFSELDGVSKDLLEAMGGKPQSKEEGSILEAISRNKAFANTEQLNALEQQAALKALENVEIETDPKRVN